MQFELARWGDKDVILLDGAEMSAAEILPFLQEYQVLDKSTDRALEYLERGKFEEAKNILKLRGRAP